MDKPDVDFIEGLSPAISIDQKSASRNPRSTVGTITEIYDYLRLLYARIGIPHCPNCGRVITRQTPQQIVDRVLELPEGTRFQVLAPVVRGRKGEYEGLLKELAGQGFTRVRIDGELHELADLIGSGDTVRLARYEQHTIEVVVDRLVRRSGIERRLTDSLETALRLAEGVAEVEIVPRGDVGDGESTETLTFSEHLACNHCGLSFDELAPRNFSFNSPYGACERCDGLGHALRGRSRARGPRRRPEPRRRRDRAVDRVPQPLLRPRARGGRRGVRLRRRHAVEEAAARRPSNAVLYGTGQPRGPRAVPQPVRAHSARTTPGSRAWSRGSSAGTPKPRATGRGSRSRATCARCRARRATARACGRRRSRSRSAASTSPSSASMSITQGRRVPRARSSSPSATG